MTQFMRAHGYLSGPTQRPATAGLLSGIVAELAGVPILYCSGALHALARQFSANSAAVLVGYCCLMALAGALYGKLFARAANDTRGGWLFGISFGFLLWMIGPVAILQFLLTRNPLYGIGAMGLLASHLAFGLALGLLVPYIQRAVQSELGPSQPPRGH